MKPKIRFGIIGCSSFAKKTTIPTILETSHAKLEMIGSRSIKKAKKFADNFSCKSYGSYDEVLENKSVDTIYLSLPIGLHEKWVIKSARAGKHILCEKSAAISYKSAKKMVHACKTNDVRLMEAFSFRFHPQHNQVLKIIKNNFIGKLFSFSGMYGFQLPYDPKNFRFIKSLGGGCLNDVGCYLICASRMIFQDMPSSIICNLYYNKKNVDTKGSLYLTFPNNQVAFGTFGYENLFQSTYELWGSKGSLKVERAFNIKNNMPATINLKTEKCTKRIHSKPSNQSKIMIQKFCKEIFQDGSTEFNFENELMNQALVLENARTSASKKCIITLKN